MQGVEAVLVVAGIDHRFVVLGRGVKVVVVVIQPGRAQGLGLVRLEHAHGGAGFHAQAFDGGDELDDFFDVAVLGRAPGCAHAKAGRARVLGGLGGGAHFVHGHELLRLHARVVLGRLRAIAAVLGATAGLDRQQRGQLHIALWPVLAVHGLGLVEQVHER